MSAATLIFPHQLFEKHPALKKGDKVFMVEDDLFFRQYPFHIQKMILHRLSMEAYAAQLKKKGFDVAIVQSDPGQTSFSVLETKLKAAAIRELRLCDPVDNWLKKGLDALILKNNWQQQVYPTPNFLLSLEESNAWFDQSPRYLLNNYYIHFRKKTGILMEAGKPVGGKWNFDEDNRKKLPKNQLIPPALGFADKRNPQSLDSIEKAFPGNYGTARPFQYPVTHHEALQNLDHFLEYRFRGYGTYQDAIDMQQSALFHSLLTPALNIGLLDPKQIVDRTLDYARQEKIAINHTEGFIRQVMGWREFIRVVYEREGSRQRTRNFWEFSQPLPKAFWTGDTGIEPVDRVIKRLLQTGYSNHIERLMILGNFMCLCEIHPDQVYEWFMTLYIDAYDWVMVPNVYGMSQFADGGIMSTKPYISGSNYILKMSHYPKGSWCAVWDALFWRFMHRHRDFFRSQPRLSMLLGTLDRMDKTKLQQHLSVADSFLRKIYAS